MKILATALTLGSGGSGGVFAPSLFIGAMAGTAFGQAVGMLFPGSTGPAGAYGLVGMAAVFSGAAWAPITAIIIVFEMTRDYNIILPLMLAVVVSTFLSRTLSRDSIYTLKLHRRGIDLQVSRPRGLFDSILVGDIMSTSYPYVNTDAPVTELPFVFESNGVHGLPVLNEGQELVGIVTATDVEHAISDGNGGRTAYEIATRSLITAYRDQSLSEVVTQPGAQEVGYIPVIDREDHKKLLGVLRRQDMISAYAKARNLPPTPDDDDMLS
jgi:CIC family chloride channel protein